MANPDTPFGCRPAFHLNGNPFNGQTMKCWVASGDGTAIYLGDAVDYAGTACVRGCCPSITKAADVNNATEVLGIAISFSPLIGISGYHPALTGNPTVAPTIYRAATTDRYANVVADPNMIYMCQGDSATTSAITDAGANCDAIDGGGSAVTGLSGIEVDVSGVHPNDKSNFFWIWGIVDLPDHDLGVTDKYYVMLKTSLFTGGTGRILGV
jgi:hypothetical protein